MQHTTSMSEQETILTFRNEPDDVHIVLTRDSQSSFKVKLWGEAPEIGVDAQVHEFSEYEEAFAKFLELCRNEAESIEIY